MGSRGGQAGGLLSSVWFCRKSIIACLTVRSSRSGPAGKHPVTAQADRAPGEPQPSGPPTTQGTRGTGLWAGRPRGGQRGDPGTREPWAGCTHIMETEATRTGPSRPVRDRRANLTWGLGWGGWLVHKHPWVHLCRVHVSKGFLPTKKFTLKKKPQSSCCGSGVKTLTSVCEDTGSTPGLAQWVWI